MPRVSVIMPAYNRAHLLPESIGSALSQGYEDMEIVVVDDGSSDNTEEVVRSIGGCVRYLRQRNSGASVARNLGILRSTGDYLLFLDSDDVLLDGALSEMARALDDNPTFGAAYCGFVETTDGEVIRMSPLDRPSGDVFAEVVSEFLCVPHSIMIRRECLARAGLFDPAMRMYEDMDFSARVALDFPFVFVPRHLVAYRPLEGGASKVRTGLREQQKIYTSKLRRYALRHPLSKERWQMALDRVYGPPRGRKTLWDAYEDYGGGRSALALKKALLAAVFDPRYLLSRTWVSFTAKALLRSLGVPVKR